MKHSLSKSFHFALMGITRTVATQRNMKIHILCALLVSLFGMAIPLDLATRAALIFAISMVFLAEILNTALEAIVDLYIGEYHRLALIAKDAAAGGVLILALGTLLVFADIVYWRLDTIFVSLENVIFFSKVGGLLVLSEALGLFWLQARWQTLLRFIFSIAVLVVLIIRSKDPSFSTLAFLLVILNTYTLYVHPCHSEPLH